MASREPARLVPLARVGGAVGAFFALKVLVGLVLVAASARFLTVDRFAVFSQLFLFLALAATIAAGGVQHGLIREVAAARDDVRAARVAIRAALAIWLVAGTLIALAALLARHWISILLVGTDEVAWAVPLITTLAAATGVGQVFCAALTGRGRAPTSLALQALGLVGGGALCLLALTRGAPVTAVIFYAAGPALTASAGAIIVRADLFCPAAALAPIRAAVRRLFGFSGAFLVTATLTPAVLFFLRQVFRDSFGVTELGYWLAANRISDVTTQLLGLYMAQAFLPAMARALNRTDGLRLAAHSLAIGTGIMLAGLLVFLAAPHVWVSLFLSAQFLPAIPFIIGYLVGDVLRVSGSIALHAALARGRLALYVGIEAASASLLAAFALTGIFMGYRSAAYLAYPAACAVVAAISWLVVWRLARRRPADAAPVDPVQGSELG